MNEQSEKQSAKQSENQNAKKPKQKIIDMKAGTKKLQQELVLVLDKAGMPKEVVNYVSTTVEKNAEDKNRKQQIYRSIISKYGQTKGLNIYNHMTLPIFFDIFRYNIISCLLVIQHFRLWIDRIFKRWH